MSLFEYPPYPIVGIRRARRVIVIDSNNIGWRCWHAPGYARMMHKGKRSGHIFGFVKTVLSFLSKAPGTPTSIVYAVDGHPKHKYAAYPAYKGNREGSRATGDPMPEVTRLVKHLPGYVLYDEVQEADDVIAAFIHRMRKREHKANKRRAEVVVVSSDQDLLQLCDSTATVIQKRASENVIGGAHVAAALGLDVPQFYPSAVPLWKAIVGDSSDNIKGVPRIRRKQLAQVFAALERSGHEIEDVHAAVQAMSGGGILSKKEVEKLLTQWDAVVKPNHQLTCLNRGLRVWPTRNTVHPRLLQRILINEYGCSSLRDDIHRLLPAR